MPIFVQIGSRIINLELITKAIYFCIAPDRNDDHDDDDEDDDEDVYESSLLVFFNNSEAPERFLAEAAEELWQILKDGTFVYIFDKWKS